MQPSRSKEIKDKFKNYYVSYNYETIFGWRWEHRTIKAMNFIDVLNKIPKEANVLFCKVIKGNLEELFK